MKLALHCASALLLAAIAAVAFPAAADSCILSYLDEVQVGMGANPGQTASGDFNHDGYNDLATVLRGQTGQIAIRLGQAGGTFAQPTYITLGAYGRGAIVALKLNGDDHLDLVTVAGEYLKVLLGNGLGSFTDGDSEHVGITPGDIAAADFDNDGDTDFAVARMTSYPAGAQIYINQGGGNLVHRTLVEVPSTFIWGIAAGDFDGDGNADLAFTDQLQEWVQVKFGAGNGYFFNTAHYLDTSATANVGPYRLTTGDFNGDGFDDIAAGNRFQSGQGDVTFAIILSGGAGRTFASAVEYDAKDTTTYDVLAHDIDSDGRLDLVVSGTDTRVFRGRGDGTFYSLIPVGYYSFRGHLAIVDIDGDGGPDILSSLPGSSSVLIAQNVCGIPAVSLTSSANPSSAGSSFTISATLTSNPAATGTLTLSQTGTGTLATANVSGATTVSATLSRPIGTYEFTVTYSGDDRFFTTATTLTHVVQSPPFGPPPGFTATSSGGAPQLSWIATSGTYQYEIFRTTGSGFVSIATTPSPSYDDLTAPPGSAILYKVRALSPALVPSAFSATDVTTTHIYTDPAIAAGVHTVKRAHMTELRTAADAVRLLAGLAPASWTDAVPTVIKRVHMSELRTAINQARTALGLAASTFDGSNLIKAVHINEARAALR